MAWQPSASTWPPPEPGLPAAPSVEADQRAGDRLAPRSRCSTQRLASAAATGSERTIAATGSTARCASTTSSAHRRARHLSACGTSRHPVKACFAMSSCRGPRTLQRCRRAGRTRQRGSTSAGSRRRDRGERRRSNPVRARPISTRRSTSRSIPSRALGATPTVPWINQLDSARPPGSMPNGARRGPTCRRPDRRVDRHQPDPTGRRRRLGGRSRSTDALTSTPTPAVRYPPADLPRPTPRGAAWGRGARARGEPGIGLGRDAGRPARFPAPLRTGNKHANAPPRTLTRRSGATPPPLQADGKSEIIAGASPSTVSRELGHDSGRKSTISNRIGATAPRLRGKVPRHFQVLPRQWADGMRLTADETRRHWQSGLPGGRWRRGGAGGWRCPGRRRGRQTVPGRRTAGGRRSRRGCFSPSCTAGLRCARRPAGARRRRSAARRGGGVLVARSASPGRHAAFGAGLVEPASWL